MKYVSSLTENRIKQLENIIKKDYSFRARMRAQAVLLSNRGYKINGIADIFQTGRDTVSSRIDSWEQSGTEGLYDNLRSGRPPILTEAEKKTAEELIKKYPQSVRTVIGKPAQATGRLISAATDTETYCRSSRPDSETCQKISQIEAERGRIQKSGERNPEVEKTAACR